LLRRPSCTDEFRRVVTQPGWEEFASSPMLYQVVTEEVQRPLSGAQLPGNAQDPPHP